MTVRDTSLEAYASVNLNRRQQEVLHYIEAYMSKPFCNIELANSMAWPINRLTPRILELRKKGVLFEAGKKLLNGRNVHLWDIRRDRETLFD